MKVISKDDLMILIPLIQDRESYDLNDFKLLLNRFGDDYYIEGNQYVKTTNNEEMAKIRKDQRY